MTTPSNGAAPSLRTRRLTLEAPGTGVAVDVTIDAAGSPAWSDVVAALRPLQPVDGALHLGRTPVPDDGPVDWSRLVDGVRLGCGGPPSDPLAWRAPGSLELRIVGGPGAGLSFPLAPGRHRIGRSGAGVVLPDDEVSRHHADLVVGTERLTIEDVGSTNGTFVEGRRITGPHTLAPGQWVQVGSTVVEVARIERSDHRLTELADGSFGLNRWFRPRDEALPQSVEFPRRPAPSERPALNLLLTLAPAVAGGVLALVLGRIEFLLLVALSPVLALVNTFSRRRAHDRRERTDQADYAHRWREAVDRLAALRTEDTRRRREALPDPAALAVAAVDHRRALWSRRAEDADALRVRVGLAAAEPAVVATGDADAPTGGQLWMVPAPVDLGVAGGVSIVGPIERGRALARSVAVQLAVHHSPGDVRLVVLTDETAAPDWAWTRWLPHARLSDDEPFVLVGNDGPSRAARRHELASVIAARRAGARRRDDGAPLPWFVVVYDGASRLMAAGFDEIVREGPRYGVFAVCVDDVHFIEGCGASVTLGRYGDDAVLGRSGSPDVADVVVDQVPPVTCDVVARALARVRPVGTGPSGGLPPRLRLLDLLDAAAPTTEAVLRRWGQGSRQSRAMVGVGAEGPVAIDLTRDGPHGVVAGASRSGKSEFLKTLVASLAFENRPDDLSFLFVDFKGGNDYLLASRLPHTVDLTTNQDLRTFDRSLRLLEAEIVRRQRLTARLQAGNIEGYWAAQANATEPTPALGRLVVIVDEFAELASKRPDQLEKLVSVARTGAAHGVHLILATQRPTGVVSGQIDANAPLRVCFRVTDDAHSLEILGTPDAAHIAGRHGGRGFKRAHQEPPVEVQTARIGNARPGSGAAGPPVRARTDPWRQAGHVPSAPPPEPEVPDPDTDMWDLVEAIRSAALAEGWQRSAVPWPKPLPPSVELGALGPVPEDDVPRVPFGLADDPAGQRQVPVTIDVGRGHVAIAGSGGTGRTTALRTIAASLAERLSPSQAHLYVLDFKGGGFGPLVELPHRAGFAQLDPELTRRIVVALERAVLDRRERFDAVGAGNLVEYNALVGEADALPWLVLLVDGWEVVNEDAQSPAGAAFVDRLTRLLADGERLGLQAVLTGDRTVGLGRIGRLVAHRYLLRFNATADYDVLEVPSRKVPPEMPQGRAIGPDLAEVQIAVVGGASGTDQTTALRALARDLAAKHAGVGPERRPRRVEAIPRRIDLAPILRDRALPDGRVPVLVGVSTDTGDLVSVDLAEDGPGFVVAGGGRTGKSSALVAMALVARRHGVGVVAVAPKRSPLMAVAGVDGVVVLAGADATSPDVVAHLGDGPGLVLVDDVEYVDNATPSLLALASGRHGGVGLVVAGTTDAVRNTGIGFLPAVRRTRAALLLCPQSTYDGSLVGTPSLPRELLFPEPSGRGVLGVSGDLQVVQVPFADAGNLPGAGGAPPTATTVS